MTSEELQRRQERARTEPMVIARRDHHFAVHSPATGDGPYEVRVNGQRPSCTCPDFDRHRNDPDWCCKHILAVEERVGPEGGAPSPECGPHTNSVSAEAPIRQSTAQMLIKRSVSPDGRIDSLSVEFSCPVNGVERDVESRAARLLSLQDSIVDRFLKNGSSSQDNGSSESDTDPDGAVPATMTSIGGTDGQWGRRLFISFKVNGRTLWRFGSPKKLEEIIAGASAGDFRGEVAEGVRLDMPCRVITKPSDDGRFLNIERVLPPLPKS